MLERNATSAPARRTRRRDVVARSPSASGSEDVVQQGTPGSHWPRSALRAARPTPTATRMVQKNFCSTICTHRLDNGSLIDAMPTALRGHAVNHAHAKPWVAPVSLPCAPEVQTVPPPPGSPRRKDE